MKHFYSKIKKTLNIALFLGIFSQSYLGNSQTTLNAGDIAFSGYNAIPAPPGDVFSFVLLKSISANTVISFTDIGYSSSGWIIPSNISTTEGTITWTSSSPLAAGTEVTITGLTASVYDTSTSTSSNNGSVVYNTATAISNGLSLSGGGDQIIAFQGGNGSVNGAGVTLICGISYSRCNANTTEAGWDDPACSAGPNSSTIPPGLVNGTSAFYTGTVSGTTIATSAKFNGTGTPFLTVAAARAALMNQANWTKATTAQTLPTTYIYIGTVPTIISHPTNKTICPSTNTTFSISASNATSYQWQVDTGSGFNNVPNSAPYSNITTSTLNITGATSSINGYQYRCVATNSSGSVNSNAATLTVPTVLTSSISNQIATSAYGLSDGSATISAAGGTTPYFYSWSPSGGTATTATNLAAGTYTVTITDSTPNGLGGCSVTQTVTITQPAGATVSVTSLSGFSTCAGSASNAQSFTVNAGGLTSNLIITAPTGYEVSLNAGGSYSSAVSIAPAGGSVSTTAVYVRLATNATGTPSGNLTVSSTGIPSKTIALTGTVNSPPSITANPSASIVCPGDNTTFTVSASNATGYQWQVDQGAGFNNISNNATYSGATTATLTITGVTAGLSGYLYRAVTTGTCTPAANSNSAALTVNSAPSISTQPSASTVCAGANTTFTVSASNATGYQWQVDQGAGFNNISNNATYSGATTATLTITGVTAGLSGYLYRAVASGTCTPTATSNNVALTVNSAPFITSQPSASTICAGANTTFTVSASSATGYQWQVDQGTGFSNISNNALYSGATTATLTITGATAGLSGYLYRAIASGTCTPIAVSNNASLTVNSSPAITAQPSASTICDGDNTTFTVSASNATGYQWQVDQGAGFNNISNNATYSGATTATLTITGATAAFSGYLYRVVATGTCTPSATSNNAALTVNHISILTSKTDIACFGDATGIATATPSGGTGSYTYAWSNGGNTATITGLIQGSYTVTVTDENSCQSLATVVIGQPSSALTLSSGIVTDTSCNSGGNGTAQVIASGGTLPYTYSWNTSPPQTTAVATGLSAGTYTVTVKDDNQCAKTLDFTISEPPALVTSIDSQTDVSCNGGANGTATVSVTGGTPGYTYSWNTVPVQMTATATGLIAGTYTVTVMDANTCIKTQSVTIGEPAVLTATKSKTDVLCKSSATGTATVTPNGGNGSYTYLWSPSGGTAATATGLATGNYSCLITDANGCSITETFFIDEPSALAITDNSTNATCSTGGDATVFPSGGVGNYSYLWTPGNATTQAINNLSAGTYTCLVTDGNGCTISKSFTISTTNTLVASTSQTDLLCNGDNTGSASVIPSGAAGPFTYAWSPSGGNADTASNLAAGNYSVTITAGNGCSIVKNFTISEPPAIAITKTSQIDVSCPTGSNGSLAVNVTGGTGAYTYSWAPSGGAAATATGLSAGTYTLTVSDANGCIKTENYTITQPDALIPSISKTDVSCNGGSNGSATVNVTGGTGAYTYLWAPSGGTAATAAGLSAGTYTVTVKDANSCQTTETVTIGEPTAITAAISKTDVLCNQANNGTATVTAAGGTGAYTYFWSPSGGTAATATGLAPDTYTVTVTDANGCFITQTIQITEPAALSAADSQTNVSCKGGNDGTATVTAAGGTGAYTYSWAPSGGTAATATGLSAGIYTVTVTDANSCSVTNTITITEPDVLALTSTAVDVSCNAGADGSATVNVTGGTGAYTYSWSPSGGTAATATGLSAGTYTVTVTDANFCSATADVIVNEPAALTATASKTDVSCNGGANGSATVSVTGGTGAYSYLWAPSGGTAATAAGLSAGTYTVTVKDANSCQTTETVTIGEPTAITAAISKTDVLCNQANNGTATVTAAGGTGAYTYSWSPSGGTVATATGLAPDTYTVTVTDANGCFITQTVQITEPAALSAADSQTNVSCKGGNDGTATVTAAGGTGAYTYSWAPSGGTSATATGLSAGIYTVTVTDANLCSVTNTITITEPDALALTSTAVDVSCNAGADGSATVNVTGGTGAYTYSWSPSGGTAATATGLSAGTYTVTVTDANSCSATADVIVNEPAALTATASKTDVSCNGGANGSATVSVTGGTGAYTYLWAPSGGTAATAAGLSAGTYTVTVKDANSCQTTETVTIGEPTAITAAIAKTDVLCNQANNGTATVTAAGGTGTYTYSWSPSGGTAATATGLAPDTYTVTVTDANGCFITQTVQITEPAALSAADSQTNVSCKGGNDGTATVTAAGGTGAYTYSWAPAGGTAATATGLSAGIYTVTVTDANSCSVTNTITITEPDVLALTSTAVDVSCNAGADGSATVNVTGGTGAYTYSWSPSGGTAATAAGLSAGTYTVTVTDANSCSATADVIVNEPAALTATASKTDVSCNGGANGSATVSVTGGTGAYTYLWAPAGGTGATAAGLSAGTYTVTVTDANSCSTVNTITIIEPDALALTATVTEISCYNGNNGSAAINVAGGSGSYSYSWAPSGGTSSIATGLSAGTYTVTVTDANSCSASINVVITQPANPIDLTTSAVSGITVTGASLSGSASSDGINNDKGECLTEVGFVYAMHANPTTADTKINVASALGTFTNSLSGLRGNRTYYVRTYAINSNGFVNYGNEVSFTTQKYTLTITATAGHTKVYGTADPVFNFTSLGLVNGDTASIITGLLSRDAGENVGKYDIKLGTINAGADYIIDFIGAEFEITKADQTITWNQTLEFGCSDSNSLVLTATTDSGLPVSYTSANPALATISGTTLSIFGSGSTTITAIQNGDQNHNAASTVVKTIEISQSGLVVQQWANVLFFDNRSNSYVAWQWYKNGVAVSGATRQYYSELQPLNGTYHVIAKDKNGNSIKSCPIEATGTVFTKKIKIYPNPVKPGSEFTLECDFSESQLNGSEVTIFDITGKLVQTISNVTSKNQIIAPSQSALYVIVLKLANGQIKTINLLVK